MNGLDPIENNTSNHLHHHRNTRDDVVLDEDDYDTVEEGVRYSVRTQTERGQKKSMADHHDRSKDMEEVEEKDLNGTKKETIGDNDEKKLVDIPLGIIGAKMMTAFGDGKNPCSSAVEEALQGTRLCLQAAIKNARALYRKNKADVRKAAEASGVKGVQGRAFDTTAPSVDPSLMYKVVMQDKGVFSGWTRKSGFSLDELRILFPEQMKEYRKFCRLRNESKSKDKEGNDEKDKAASDKEGDSDSESESGEGGGHMHMRREVFDLRTKYMKQDWYMTFAEVRYQGSFLPPSKTSEEREWNNARKGGRRGRPNQSSWEGRSASSVQFLYWIGFDPRSALPPPNEKITQFLAFLGYDMMGRIIERALQLRYQGKHLNSFVGLPPGEQLTKEDISNALSSKEFEFATSTDPTNSSRSIHKPQLYFGPGFEANLEAELEQLSNSKSENHHEDSSIKEAEDELFSSLVKPRPLLHGVTDLLDNASSPSTQLVEQRKRTKRLQQQTYDNQKTQKRGRGRPKTSDVQVKKRGRPRKTTKDVDSDMSAVKSRVTYKRKASIKRIINDDKSASSGSDDVYSDEDYQSSGVSEDDTSVSY